MAWLKRIYVLFFISLESRRIEFVACTPNPTGAWVAQQARNLLMTLEDRQQPLRFVIHDRDAKFSGGCDQVFRSGAIAVIRTPIQAPNANAHAERWVGSVRRECLDRLLIFNRRQLEHVLRVYARHYKSASAPSGTRTSSTRASRRKPDTAASASLSAAKSQGPARRADPRVRARSLTGDQSLYASTALFHSTALFDTPLCHFFTARPSSIRPYVLHARANTRSACGVKKLGSGGCAPA
jgi:hypothetical protein